jgi:hypothetical protein
MSGGERGPWSVYEVVAALAASRRRLPSGRTGSERAHLPLAPCRLRLSGT